MIPVQWLNFHPDECHPREHWDTAIFQELILKDYPQWRGDATAVVMVAGRFHAEGVRFVNTAIKLLTGCVVVIHSDEESLFPWWELDHPNMRRWVMTPSPDTKPTEGVRFIGEGWSPGTPGRVNPGAERTLVAAFMGQDTHERRHECIRAMLNLGGSVFVNPTQSFAAGFDPVPYMDTMCRAKFAPCPSGPVTADSFRVYEALEAGCVPILDCVDGQGRDAMNLWKLMLGDHPLPLIRDWSFLPALVETLLPEWETLQAEVQAWWSWRKDQWVTDMAEDVKAIS